MCRAADARQVVVGRAVTRLALRRSDVASRPTNQGGDARSLASLIERSAGLKRALVDFALSPRMERHLERFMVEGAGPDGVLIEDEAIDAVDRFALLYRLPNGKSVLDQFLASWPDLSAADREMLRRWRDPVDGIFEIRGRDGDSLILLNLVDDLEYRAYSNMGPVAFRPLPKHGFVYARLVPIGSVPGAWLISGSMRAYASPMPPGSPRPHSNSRPECPNWPTVIPRKSSRRGGKCGRSGPRSWSSSAATSWSFRLQRSRNESTPSTGTGRDPRLPGGLRAVGRRTSPGVDVPAFELPAELADADTIGVIYDEIDGLNFYNEYGMLRDLFADPALAADKRYADALRGYLRAETIGPLPFRRLAVSHRHTVDSVFRKILHQPHFTWADHGEALLRRRKSWYFEHEPRPNRTVIGARLSELLSR